MSAIRLADKARADRFTTVQFHDLQRFAVRAVRAADPRWDWLRDFCKRWASALELRIVNAKLPTSSPTLARYAEWANEIDKRPEGKTIRSVAEDIAKREGVDISTVEREARRVRQKRENGRKTGN